jgi:predicted acetyltransferase
MAPPTGKLKFAYQTIANMELKINELERLNQDMHTQVAGYLKGKEWVHWQEFNEAKFKLENNN